MPFASRLRVSAVARFIGRRLELSGHGASNSRRPDSHNPKSRPVGLNRPGNPSALNCIMRAPCSMARSRKAFSSRLMNGDTSTPPFDAHASHRRSCVVRSDVLHERCMATASLSKSRRRKILPYAAYSLSLIHISEPTRL